MAATPDSLKIMFENKRSRLLPFPQFLGRMAKCFGLSALLVALALILGSIGYHVFAKFSWIDAFLNACMILTGMGPVGELKTTGAKLFAACYALFSGLVFLSIISVAIAPVLHRFFHKLHMDAAENERKD